MNASASAERKRCDVLQSPVPVMECGTSVAPMRTVLFLKTTPCPTGSANLSGMAWKHSSVRGLPAGHKRYW